MEHYRTGPHTRYDLKYHFAWVTKYRKQLPGGELGRRLRGRGYGNWSTRTVSLVQLERIRS